MDENFILNIIVLFIMIMGIATIVMAAVSPTILIKLDNVKVKGKNYTIKDKEGYIKYNQKVYVGYGILTSIVAILSLTKIIDFSTFCIVVSIIAIIFALANSLSIKKYV